MRSIGIWVAVLGTTLTVGAWILVLLARRSSALRPTFQRALLTLVLSVIYSVAALWLLNPWAPELDPIAVVARSILATLLIALGSVRVFQFVLGTTYGHAWYLFGVSTAFNGALVLAIAQLIAKSDPIE